MLEQFRIKEGGAGNVVSDAQGKGLSQGELLPRNSAVDATPFAPDYTKPLVILYNNRYEEQLAQLLEDFRKKTSYLDDIYDIYNKAYAEFNGANPPAFLIVYAKSAMLNKALIHYNKKPEIATDDDGSYRESSNLILKSNGGIISADVNKQESPCIFYHPFAWQYIVERLDFIAKWRAVYDGYDVDEGYGGLESEARPYEDHNEGLFFGFAPFGLASDDPSVVKVGDIRQTHSAQLNIDTVWVKPIEGYYQMRYGEPYTPITQAPYRFVDFVPQNVVISEMMNDGVIWSDTALEFVPVFTAKRGDYPLKLSWTTVYNQETGDKIAVSQTSGSVTSLDKLQRASLVKSPFYRSTWKEFAYTTEDQPISTSEIRSWVEANLVPPHLSNGEWWERFYNQMAITGASECGEYGLDSGEACGVVYAMSSVFRFSDDYKPCTTEPLPNLINVFRTLDIASDYTDWHTGVEVISANDSFEVNTEMRYEVAYAPRVKIRLNMDIGSGWTMLPEDVVRASLKNSAQTIANALKTDGDVSAMFLELNGVRYELVATSGGANINLEPIISNAGIDFDNTPLEELINTLRTGFSVVWLNMNAKSGSYMAVGERPTKLLANWRNK